MRKFVDLRDCPKMFDKYRRSRFYGELMIDGSIPVAVYCVSDKYDADRFGACVFGNKIKRPRYSQSEIDMYRTCFICLSVHKVSLARERH